VSKPQRLPHRACKRNTGVKLTLPNDASGLAIIAILERLASTAALDAAPKQKDAQRGL